MSLICGDALTELDFLDSDSIDCIVTDPPYGYSFMNKDWDRAVVGVDIWKDCLRVLKPGAFAFIMSSPRQDVLSRMIVNLQEAGFRTDFTSIYWTYASGFPKAADVSKLADKRNGRNSEEYKQLATYIKESRIRQKKSTNDIAVLFPSKTGGITGCVWNWENAENVPTQEQYDILKNVLELDNTFDELIEREEAEREIIGKDGRTAKESMFNLGIQKEWDITKPSTIQAKKLEGSYAGFQPKPAVEVILVTMKPLDQKSYVDQALSNQKGITWLDDCRLGERFPANLLVQDDILNSFSHYFSVDQWYNATFPFLITPKASKSEKNMGLITSYVEDIKLETGKTLRYNSHPTVKPIKLMSYLIMLGSREGDTILDPFVGSGTTVIAAQMLKRKWIGIDNNQEYIDIAWARVSSIINKQDITLSDQLFTPTS